MMTELIASDGHKLDCWIEPAKGERRGGLVIIQEIFGVTDQLKGLAGRYAEKGYEVAIPALFDRREKGAVIPFDQAPRGRDLMLACDLNETVTDIDATVQALAANGGKVGVMGFCWGGGLAIRAAQKLGVACAIAFYGTQLPQYLDSPLKAPLLGHFGKTDDHVPPEMLKAVQDYLPEMEIHLYDAGHAFANDARPAAYDAGAAELAHERSEAFLARYLG
jgi:carboxymethylenebutenolidase